MPPDPRPDAAERDPHALRERRVATPALVTRLAERSPTIETRTADLLDMASVVPETFDVVLSSEVIEHTPDPKAAVRSLCARVASGGHLALSVPNRRWIWRRSWRVFVLPIINIFRHSRCRSRNN